MNEKKPLISVVMATYNESSEQIEKSISSILNQTYENFELLIYDDSTNENTKNTINRFKVDSRVRIQRSPERLGLVKSANKGLAESKGKYIARMDGDDIALPDRFEKEVAFLETHPDIFVVGGAISIINENDEVVSKRVYPQKGLKLRLFSCFRSPFANPTVLMRRELVDVGFRYDVNLKKSEDLDFWLRIQNEGYKFANLQDVVLRYRVGKNFNEKRNYGEQWKYTFYVRKKNFSFRYFFFSVLSVISGFLLFHAPIKVMDSAYNKENNLR